MKKLVTVIGEPNFGKSTIIQSFTGFELRASHGLVRDNNTQEFIYVYSASPQELDQITLAHIEAIRDQVENDPLGLGIVLALQPIRARIRPRMEACIGLFTNRPNWGLFNFFITTAYSGTPSKHSIVDIDNMLRTVNATTTSPALDGRRFAFRNSSIIQSVTNLY